MTAQPRSRCTRDGCDAVTDVPGSPCAACRATIRQRFELVQRPPAKVDPIAARITRENAAASTRRVTAIRPAPVPPGQPYVLTLPLPPNVANAEWHHRARIRAREAYKKQCHAYADAWQLPPIPEQPMPRVRVRVAFLLGARMDDDNLTAREKWARDWIVEAGYVVADDPSHWTGDGRPTQRVTRSEPYSVTFTLTPDPSA